ncbi:response regulator [Dactylosporangium sp. NPDC051541]|uniref:response regulator n=1 Tax=Dactylosporangium sp. NPDC051541 TaxID=3363977 RepID=UPI0037AF1E0B
MIRVALADDQPLARAGLRVMLSAEADIEVVAEAAGGVEAVDVARRYRPDVMIMDVRMPGVDGIEATRRIAGAVSGVRVLVLTTFDVDEYVFGALRAGASGFLLKDAEPEAIAAAVRVVARGDALLDAAATRKVVAAFVRRPPGRSAEAERALARLTEREVEVVRLVALGLTNDEIGARLGISAATARTHVSRSIVKVGARDRVQLVVFAYRWGLVEP